MKPFKHKANWLLVTTLAFALAGCGRKEGAMKGGHGRQDEPGVSFSAKSGLRVTPETGKFIGLVVAEVEERKVAAVLRFAAFVYRAGKEGQYASTLPVSSTTTFASAVLGSSDAALLHEGQRVMTEAESVGMFPGQVTAVNRHFAKAAGQVEVLLAITDEQARLAKGAFLTVSVPLGGEKSVASVPRSALLQTTEGHFVYTVSGERFVRAPVKLGVVNHEFAEVTDGLFEGDKIVVNPVMTLWMAELQSIRGGKACADGH